MRKHIILIMNILLIAVISGALVYTFTRMLSVQPEPVEPTEAAVETEAPTEEPTVGLTEHFKVGIVQHTDGENSNNCYAGFISQLNSRGLLDNIDIVYVVEEDGEKCISEIQRLVDEGCDLLYTIGPFASKHAAAISSEIPIVFAGVGDPEEAGLVESNEAPGGNITGVSSYTPCFEQIDLIPVLMPKAKNVASIYNATDENAVRQAIIASWEAEEFEYTAERYPVSDRSELLTALDSILQKKIDVIYLPIDKLIIKNLDAVSEFSINNKIPVICGNKEMMKEGCLATCEINYTSIGRKSADLSYDILFGKKDTATLPVIYKYDCYNLVNKQVLEKLGLRLTSIAKENVEIIDCSKEE